MRIAFVLLALLVAPPARAGGELTVFAAASLREAFTALGRRFEETHPGARAAFDFAGSQELRTQIENGAPADVFASADEKHMKALVADGLAAGARVFARNQPVIAVPKGNPQGLRDLRDLPRARRIVIGVPEVPIGAYTLQILDAAAREYGADFRTRVLERVVSRELNVRQVLAKVGLGEADAAIVYRTDAAGAKRTVEAISIPAQLNVVAEYPIAPLKKAQEPQLAADFVALVLSPAGQRILAQFGFQAADAR